MITFGNAAVRVNNAVSVVGGGNKLVSVLAAERSDGSVIVDNVVAVRPLEEYAQVEAFPFEVIGETSGVDGQDRDR